MPVPQGPAGVKKVMGEFKTGELHSGSKTGPTVTNRKQAVAIALKQSGQSKYGNTSPKKNFKSNGY